MRTTIQRPAGASQLSVPSGCSLPVRSMTSDVLTAAATQAIGTGGRDVKREVGGIMFLEALAALRDDPATRVVVLISKPPHETVLRRIGEAVAGIGKPVIAAFLGAGEA